jgi:enoyl-CoA hydratase/carnithine racemase
MYETLRVDREGHLTWLTLNRPESLNAMSRTLIRELGEFFWACTTTARRASSSCVAPAGRSARAST